VSTARGRLDDWDRRILRILQSEADISMDELARRLKTLPELCKKRVQMYDANGIIQSRVTLIDAAAVNLRIVVFAIIRLKRHSREIIQALEQRFRDAPAILECFATFNDDAGDYVLKIVVSSLEEYRYLLAQQLLTFSHFALVESIVVLQVVKASTALPL